MAIILSEIYPKSSGALSVKKAKSENEKDRSILRFFGKPVKSGEMIFFTSQLSLMLEIGMSLGVALRAISTQTKNSVFKSVIREIYQDIEEGRQFSHAMGRHPKIFDHIFISMVKAGETGGFLKKILDRMVFMQEKRQELITQFRSSMTYPVVLCILASLVVIFVLVGVLPRFTVLFEGKEHILPATTRFLNYLSVSLRTYSWIYVLGGVTFAVSLKKWISTKQGRAFIGWAAINLPVLRVLVNKMYICQFLRTLGNLMESRVPLLEALSVTRATFGTPYYRNFAQRIADHVEKGGKFSQPFADSPHIIESVKQMVATGEEVGNLPMVMLRLAEFYDTEVDQELKLFSALIEPLALLFLGTVIGIIVSSVILPMFKIAQMVH